MRSKILSIVFNIATSMFAFITVAGDSDRIVLYWDFYGDITCYGSTYLILFLPCVSVLLSYVFRSYEMYPYKIKGFPKVEHNEHNRQILIAYIRIMSLLVLSIILYVTLCSTQILNMQPPIIIIILFFIVANYIYTYRKIKQKD